MKIDQQAHGNAKQAEMGKQLRFINRMQGFLALGFNDNAIFDDEVCSTAAVKFDRVVD